MNISKGLALFVQINEQQTKQELKLEMKQTSEVGRADNVISLSIKQNYDPNTIPFDVAHPASVHYDIDDSVGGSIDDPLSELLHEFDDIVGPDLDEKDEAFIFHHQRPWNYQVHYKDDAKHMADTIIDQLKRLKEDSKRLKYYLDEMDLD